MRAQISSDLLQRMIELAAAQDEEICGLLLGEGPRIDAIIPAANVAADPRRHFEIDPAVLLSAHRAARAGGPKILGHYHSHPSGDPTPSARDAANAAPDGGFWLILAPPAARLWRAEQGAGREVAFLPVALDML